jgi:hypothetical protein
MKFGGMLNFKMINIIMEALTAAQGFFTNSSIHREFFEEREEVLKHKWLESEKKGYDIGYSAALIEWILKHRTNWRNHRKTHNHE